MSLACCCSSFPSTPCLACCLSIGRLASGTSRVNAWSWIWDLAKASPELCQAGNGCVVPSLTSLEALLIRP
jgi:hypothetical protein